MPLSTRVAGSKQLVPSGRRTCDDRHLALTNNRSNLDLMLSISRFCILSLLLTLAGAVLAQTDSTIRTRNTITVNPSRPDEERPTIIRSVYYLHSTMRRIDTVENSGKVTFTKVNNCATRSGLIADQRTKEYRILNLPRLWSEEQMRDYVDKHPADAVRIDSRTVGTGEKKVLLGLPARHFITTIERTMKNGISGSETVDAWYVEHERIECPNSNPLQGELTGAILVTYPEVPDAHHDGPVPMGLPVEVTHTAVWRGGKYGADGKTMKSERIVESISDSPIDPKTFDVPAGFRENPDLLK
jgi:hypothetical protein